MQGFGARQRQGMDSYAAVLTGSDELHAAAAAQSLVLRCRKGGLQAVARGLSAEVVDKVLDLAAEGDRLCFVFVALLKYLACDGYLRTSMLSNDRGYSCLSVCMGLLLAQEPLVTAEVLGLLGALAATPPSARRLAEYMAAYPPLLKALLAAAHPASSPPADAAAALPLVSLYLSTSAGCEAAKPYLTRIHDLLQAVPRSRGVRRHVKEIVMYLNCAPSAGG
eukprot:TRINITY_DN7998_c0_g1_i2.p1 TRINITY_DN7998_c0_g1~~TRINITY_DN7998_c0_g1_i2.p1  ORF type:complete len:222 (+),score=43.03 TRINITY_DN7998_c0_g1_i2:1436-2101(+)